MKFQSAIETLEAEAERCEAIAGAYDYQDNKLQAQLFREKANEYWEVIRNLKS